jgi:hypothetical protein
MHHINRIEGYEYKGICDFLEELQIGDFAPTNITTKCIYFLSIIASEATY